MSENLKRLDYHKYYPNALEQIVFIGKAGGIVFLISYFFYRSIWAFAPLCSLGVWYYKRQLKERCLKRKEELAAQFRECLLAVSGALQAGYAVENAFVESREDMKNLYGEKSLIYGELEFVRRGLMINISLEELLSDLAKRSDVEEIKQFAQVFSIAKRSGGNLPQIIQTTANLSGQQAETRQEVDILLAGKRMEQNVMRVMPFGILLYIGKAYPGYFEPLYHNIQGNLIMSGCLFVYVAAYLFGEKIIENIGAKLSGQNTYKLPKIPEEKHGGILGMLDSLFRKIYKKENGRGRLFCNDMVMRNLSGLYPGMNRVLLLENYYVKKLSLCFLVGVAGLFFALILWLKAGSTGGTKDALLLLVLFETVAVGLFFLMDKDLKDEMNKKKNIWKYQYPDLIHKLVLYLGAGLSIRSSFAKLAPQYETVRYANREIEAGIPEMVAYEHFGKRTNLQSYVKLATLLNQNLKRGTNTLFLRLEEEALQSAQERIQNGKRLGEEAGTKLLLPMAMMLGIIMLMIMIPAFTGLGI